MAIRALQNSPIRDAGLAAMAVICLAVAGCGGSGTRPPRRSKPSPAPVRTTKSAAPAAPQTVPQYLNSTARNARLRTAVGNFGKALMRQYRMPSSKWGPFDVYCSGPNSATGGWVSQGYKARPGQDCGVQHNPQYGGQAIQVDADVTAAANGYLSSTRTTGAIITLIDGCSTMIDPGGGRGWIVNNDLSRRVSGRNDSNLSSTVAQARYVDNTAIACLKRATATAKHL